MKTPLRPSCRLWSTAIAAFLLSAPVVLAAPTVEDISSALKSRRFADAVTVADAFLAAKGKEADHATYLKALAQFHAKNHAGCVGTTDALLSGFPQSEWRQKTIFLKAQALTESKKFDQAAVIYENEATRLLAPERKAELIAAITKFAEKLTAKPDPKQPDAPKPDFRKAYSLYEKALAMEISREMRDELLFRKARAIQQAGDPQAARRDFEAYLQEFDPEWTGAAGSGANDLPALNPPPAGKNVLLARFRFAESVLQCREPEQARLEFEDLLKIVTAPDFKPENEELKKLPEEIRWLQVLSFYTRSNRGEAVEIEVDPLLPGLPNQIEYNPPELPNSVGNGQGQSTRVFITGNSIDVVPTQSLDAPAPTGARIFFRRSNGTTEAMVKAGRAYLTAHPAGTRAIRVAWMLAEVQSQAGRAEEALAAYRAFIEGKDFRLPEGEAANTMEEEIRNSPAAFLSELRMNAVYRIGQILAAQKKHTEAIATWQSYIKDFPNGPLWSDSQNAVINSEFELGLEALTAGEDALAMQRFEAFLRAHPLDERSPRILYIQGVVHEAKAVELQEKKAPDTEIAANYRRAIEEWAKLISKYPESDEAMAAQRKCAWIHEEKLGEFEKALQIYGKISDNGATARLTNKSLDVSSDRVFRTNEKAVVTVKTRNIEQCEVRLYKIDLQAYFRKMHAVNGVETLDVSLIQPDKSWTWKPDGYAKYQPLTREIEIPFPDRQAGAYVVTVGDDDWESTVLVLRSDLEMVVKSSRREVLAFVQDMVTGKAAAGVDVLVSDGASVVITGKTGPDGVFKTSLKQLETLADVRVFALRSGHAASYNLPLAGLGLSSGLTPKGYLYTERPAYLPGEMVNMRGILRDVKDGAYALPEDAKFLLGFTDPQGRLLSEQSVTTGRFGTFDAKLQLPESAPTGTYTMTARQEKKSGPGLTFQGQFEVRHFKLEKIKLAMDFARPICFRGEAVEMDLTAAYHWGEPLANRVIRCTLPDRRTERVTTDAAGKAKLKFDTTGMIPGSVLSFTASLDGENVSTTGMVRLAKLGFSIGVKPSQEVVIAGEPVDIELSTTGADGKPCGQALKVKVLRIEQPKTSRILSLLPWAREAGPTAAEVLASELDARTDEQTGKARVGLTLDKGGIYRIRVTGTDRFGQEIASESSLRVSDDEDHIKLRLFAAESTLKVGQESMVRLHSRMERGLALVTWEGETILQHRILELKKDNNEIPLNIGHDLFPNFRLAVAAIDGRELRLAAKEFTVERELKVAIKPVKEFFLPGEEGKVEITVTDQNGQPVEAELSLALVNQALFGIYPDTLTPILDFFQREARRQAGFHAGATCGFGYSGTTRPVNRAIVDEAQRRQRDQQEVLQMQQARNGLQAQWAASGPLDIARAPQGGRSDDLIIAEGQSLGGGFGNDQRIVDQVFSGLAQQGGGGGGGQGEAEPPRKDVQGDGRWLPSIVTGSDGKARATISMPESTTGWRLTARGCSVDTLVGQATAATITRKDFFVSMKAPSFAREGDALRVVGRVHNLTDFTGAVPVTLRMLDAKDRTKVLATREKSVDVPAKGGAETVFDAITIPARLEVVLELSAKGGENSDRLEIQLPVQPWGLPYIAHAGGVASADTMAMLELPGGREYTSRWMTLSVGPELQGAVIDMAMANTSGDMPMARIMPPVWGGHPAHDLLAVASGLAYANATAPNEPRSRALVERARSLVSNLVSSQNKEGRWEGLATDPNLTARAFWALIAARDAGIAVHKPTLDQAAAALQKQFESLDANDHDGKAIILHALSCDKRADFAHCNRLYRERNALGNATLAYLTRAFFNLDRKEIALELAGILESKAKPGDGPIALWESGNKLPWMNDNDETTAIVLLALAESKPQSPRAEAAAAYLLQSRGCFGFSSARARGPAVAALAVWFGKGKEEATDLEIAIQVNDKEVGLVKFPDPAQTGSSMRMLEIPSDLLADGKNRVEFKVKGRGKFTWAATLSGFSPDTKETGGTTGPVIARWEHFHAPLEYRGKSIGVNSTSVVKNLPQGDLVNVRMNFRNHGASNRAFIIDIPLPAGARLLPESIALSDSRHRHEITATGIRVYGFNYFSGISYDLAGYVPGQFRVLPATIREIGNPAFLVVGPTTGLTVLPHGEKSPDAYQMNIAERYALGKAHFDDGDDAKALEYLAAVFKEQRQYNESEVARMLLWIYTKPEFRDAAKMVEMFEVLRERYASLEIPFDKILAVAKAYRDLGEHERSWLVYRAVITASFANDSGISAVLEDEGRFLASIDFQQKLWREYPDTADVVTSHFALSQLLFEKAPNAHALPKEDGVQPEKVAMLKRTALLLSEFLALYPLDPLADDAGFSLCNCLLDLKDYAMVVDLSRNFAKLHAESELAPGFQYMTALGLFWQKKNDEALAAARIVADGESKDRDFARYILGQVHHATGKPEEAIRWYGLVKELYPDASEAIAYFEKKHIGLDEVIVFKPGQPVELTLRHRNVKEAFVQIYRVDLMKLYLQQKNLSAITSVQLAGIRPESEETIQLGDGKDYVEKEKRIPLKLKDEAAYLVICRGDDLFASGMVLITPLKIEIQEDPVNGRVRANVLDTSKGGYRPEVHVKAIGSADTEFRSGETDLRGLFIADNLRGKSTVIAREGESRYAFFRGDTWLGAPENAPAQPVLQQMEQQGKPLDFKGNLSKDNDMIQQLNTGKFDENRRKVQSKGVKAEAAY